MNKSESFLDKRRDYKTYMDYKKLSSSNTEAYLMLSELIDNSLSSWLDNNENVQGLKIRLKIFYASNDKDSYIECVDNAYGMNKDELQEAVKLNKIQNKKNIYNVHWRGLKQSAFFFGQTLEIHTNNGKTASQISIKITDKNLNDPVWLEPTLSDYKIRGTVITISNLNSKKCLSHNLLEEVKKHLGWRYGLAIQSGLEISIEESIARDTNYFEEPELIEPHLPVPAQMGEMYLDMNKKIIKVVQDEIMKKTENELKKLVSNNLKEDARKLSKKLIDFLNTSDSDKYVKFAWETRFSGHPVQLNFGWLSSGSQKWRGITIYEGIRAIYHGPNDDKQSNFWPNPTFETGSPEFSFIGDINLTGIVETSTDKATLLFSSEQREELKELINFAFQISKPVLMTARGLRNSNSQKLRQTAIENAKTIALSKYESERVIYDDSKIEKGIITYYYTLKIGEKKEPWKIKIEAQPLSNVKTLYKREFKESENIFKLIVNISHDFWKKSINLRQEDFYNELVVPLALIFANIEIVARCYKEEKKEDLIADINNATSLQY